MLAVFLRARPCYSPSQVTGVPQGSLVAVVKPGLPTTADLYVLPADSKAAARSVFIDKVCLAWAGSGDGSVQRTQREEHAEEHGSGER